MPAYSITPVPYNDIQFRSGRVVELLTIEDVPSSVTKVRMDQQCPSNIEIPIIEVAKIPTKTPTET